MYLLLPRLHVCRVQIDLLEETEHHLARRSQESVRPRHDHFQSQSLQPLERAGRPVVLGAVDDPVCVCQGSWVFGGQLTSELRHEQLEDVLVGVDLRQRRIYISVIVNGHDEAESRRHRFYADAVALTALVPLPLVPGQVVDPGLVDVEDPSLRRQQLEELLRIEVAEHERAVEVGLIWDLPHLCVSQVHHFAENAGDEPGLDKSATLPLDGFLHVGELSDAAILVEQSGC